MGAREQEPSCSLCSAAILAVSPPVFLPVSLLFLSPMPLAHALCPRFLFLWLSSSYLSSFASVGRLPLSQPSPSFPHLPFSLSSFPLPRSLAPFPLSNPSPSTLSSLQPLSLSLARLPLFQSCPSLPLLPLSLAPFPLPLSLPSPSLACSLAALAPLLPPRPSLPLPSLPLSALGLLRRIMPTGPRRDGST